MSILIRDVIRRLNALIRLDQASSLAYTTAITNLTNAGEKDALKVRLADHRRHVEELARLVRNLGGEPVGWRDFTPARLGRDPKATGDAAFLEPLRYCEQAVLEAYQDAASQPGVPGDISMPLRNHLAEEQAHMAWIYSRLRR